MYNKVNVKRIVFAYINKGIEREYCKDLLAHENVSVKEGLLIYKGFELDLFSTQLSRRNSFHVMHGKKRYVKVRN
jgi:hypothetical protein